jgi:UDP-2,3-diacylglucosamine pyrophosphatase LpxH
VIASALYIISDLHLCDGTRVEDFRSDDERALVSWLFRIGHAAPVTLLINGDFIDFVQIQPRPNMWLNAQLDATEAESLEKLDAAVRAHGPVFDALGRFVAAGNSLRFHWGNHDIDLAWPRVQARLRERLAKRALYGAITFGGELSVGGLYVAHGHQADPTNRFAHEPDVTHTDPHGVERLERCWGTRLVEEFYNKIEALDGCDMLDNVRPRMQAAVTIIKHAILQREMHPTLHAGVQVISDTLAELVTEEDVTNAADQLGVSRSVLSWIVSVAGWLGVGNRSRYAPKGAAPVFVTSLETAYSYGAALRDGEQLAQLAPSATAPISRQLAPKSPGAGPVPSAEYTALASQRAILYAAALARHAPELQAFCFGHTHQAITAALAVDALPGWPLPGTGARLYNSGSWTRTLDLSLVGADATFEFLRDVRNYRLGRDYLRVTWPADPGVPLIDTLSWA